MLLTELRPQDITESDPLHNVCCPVEHNSSDMSLQGHSREATDSHFLSRTIKCLPETNPIAIRKSGAHLGTKLASVRSKKAVLLTLPPRIGYRMLCDRIIE